MIVQRGADAAPATNGVPEIVVGTDGTAASAAAVQYALNLGAERGAPVRIVHVVPGHHPIPPFLKDAVHDAGQDLLLDVTRRAQLAAPQVEVRSSLLVGPRRAQFLAAAQGAGTVVLGRSGRLSHLATGSTAAAVIEHTDCPVRIVPPEWRQRAAHSEVIVGIKDIAKSRELITRGFEIAAELGQPLVLLHAWGLPSGYEEVVALTAAETWNKQLSERIEKVALTIRKDFEDVPFQVRIEHARTAVALEAASQRASFLLLGRSSHHNPVGHRTGLVHVIMNVSECPVEIGPEPREPAPELNLELEADGELLK